MGELKVTILRAGKLYMIGSNLKLHFSLLVQGDIWETFLWKLFGGDLIMNKWQFWW